MADDKAKDDKPADKPTDKPTDKPKGDSKSDEKSVNMKILQITVHLQLEEMEIKGIDHDNYIK